MATTPSSLQVVKEVEASTVGDQAPTPAAGSLEIFANQNDTFYKKTSAGVVTPLVGGASSVSNSDGTLTISPTTGAVIASLAATYKAKIDNLWVDANNIGIDASFSGATNRAAFNTWYATAPNWVTLKFPADPSLYYDFDAELALNRDIRIRFLGDGKGRSILRTTSATANLFNQSVAGFYISFEELGFGATVNKTAGAAIVASGANSLLDVRRCEFQSQFRSIDLSSTAGNIGVINECVFNTPATTAGGSQIRINGSNINMMIQNSTINVTGQDVIGLEILASGAVQIDACDFIGGRNTMLLNSTGGGIAAVFCTNVFLDQATLGPTLLIKGTGTLNRIKFIGCGITNGANGTNAIEIAGTGTGTGIPEGIDFFDTDVYNNGFTGTTKGFLVTGVRGFTVRGSRIAGFTQGFDITPYSANGITNFDISDNTIGPSENFAGNGTGILINAGAVQFGSYTITDNDMSANTTAALTDNGTIGATGYKIIDRNLGLVLAAQPNNPAQLLPITTATKVGRSIIVPANGARVGTRMRKEFTLTKNSTASTLALTLRNGTTDTNADATATVVHTVLVGTAAIGLLKVVVDIQIVTAATAVATIWSKNGAFGATTGFAATHEQFTFSTLTAVTGAAPACVNVNTLQYWGLWSVTTVAGNTSTVVADDETIRF